MSGSFLGTRTSHYNPDAPRDWHGRWTTGGSSWQNTPLHDPTAIGRARTFLGHGLAGAIQQGVIPDATYPTRAEGERTDGPLLFPGALPPDPVTGAGFRGRPAGLPGPGRERAPV